MRYVNEDGYEVVDGIIHDEGWADYEIDRRRDDRLEELDDMERDLIPCPHCAGHGRFANGNFGGKAVVCAKCGASSGYKDTEEEAALAWNTRAERTCNLIADGDLLHCSNCGGAAAEQSWAYWDYCPNCGARVERGE